MGSLKYKVNVIFLSIILSCQPNSQVVVDHLVTAERIYICNEQMDYAEAMVVHEGRIVETGSKDVLLKKYKPKELVEHNGYIYPGFIDAHSHFYGFGKTLEQVELKGTASLEEVIERTQAFAANSQDYWVHGRGWDQTDWTQKGFPTNTKLNLLFPDRPVILRRIDGHAALANQKAMDLAGIDLETKVEGGEIEIRNGRLTGILIDNAADLVLDLIPEPGREAQIRALKKAQEACFAVGLTTVTDAGLDLDVILLMDSLQQAKALQMRIYAMANPSPENFAHWLSGGSLESDLLSLRSFKLYADGALGSRGAKLKEPYCDHHDHQGFWLTAPERLDSICQLLFQNGFQVNTHCIGDSANRLMLETYAKYLSPNNDMRWRIEHAQVVSPEDRALFSNYNIIPSVQPTHATSDMNWADQRLCEERMEGAYAYKSLLACLNFLPLGTDFPIEDISPIQTYHAAVFRTDANRKPLGGFQPEEALSPKEALLGMTLWAARASFLEDRIGSLEAGKVADFVVLDKDLLRHSYPYAIKVQETWASGIKVYTAQW